jgi:hypothetical protein
MPRTRKSQQEIIETNYSQYIPEGISVTTPNVDIESTEAKKPRIDITSLGIAPVKSERSAKASHSNAGRKASVSPYQQVIQDSYDNGTAFELNEVSLEVIESVRSHLRTVAGKMQLGLDMSVYEVAGRSDVVDLVVQARTRRVLKRKTDTN